MDLTNVVVKYMEACVGANRIVSEDLIMGRGFGEN